MPVKDCWNSVDVFVYSGRGNDNLDWNDFQMFFKVIKIGTKRKLVYDFLLVLSVVTCCITHRLREVWCETVMTLKYCQGWQLYHLKAVVWFLISKFSFCGRIVYSEIGRGNDSIGWNDLQMPFKVIGRRGTNRKLVYKLLLVVYSNFLCTTHRFRDARCFNAENHIFAYSTTYLTLNLKVMLLKCEDEIWRQKTSCHMVKKSWS